MAGFAADVAGALRPGFLRLRALVCFVPGRTAIGAGEWSLAPFTLAFEPALFSRKQQIFLIGGLWLNGLRRGPLIRLQVQIVDGLLFLLAKL